MEKEYPVTRLISTLTFATMVLAALNGPAWSQFGGAKPRSSGSAAGAPSSYPPGAVWILGSEAIQEEVGLSAQQRRGVADLFAKFRANMQQNAARVQSLPREQQAEEMAALREKASEQLDLTRRRIEALLSPQQLEMLEKIDFRMRALTMLMNSNTLEQLRLSSEQKEKLHAVYEQMEQKVQTVQRDISDKVVDVLTPEQRQHLKHMIPSPR
jgi:hypothetical protein